jgi:hypothetical protein
MDEQTFTIIDAGVSCPVTAAIRDDCVRLSPAALRAVFGWELKREGLCKDDHCIPLGASNLVADDGLDLVAFARLLSRPIATDIEARVAYLGASAAERAAQLASLHAPDFTLPDLDGQRHSLSDYRGKKVLLVAYASW